MFIIKSYNSSFNITKYITFATGITQLATHQKLIKPDLQTTLLKILFQQTAKNLESPPFY